MQIEVHHTGLIIGGAWWDLQKGTGLRAAHELLYRSLNLIPDEMNFFDVRDALVTADENLNGGANVPAIQDSFRQHGLEGSDPGQPGTFEIRHLKTATGLFPYKVQKTFHAGELILVFAGYKGTNLTPGYNIYPVEFELKGPSGTQPDIFITADEVSNGIYKGRKGAIQAYIFTDNNPAPGAYNLTLRSRLGGSQVESVRKSVTFEISQ